jgi:dsDNA-specific endonuclease/ATPase MutS2
MDDDFSFHEPVEIPIGDSIDLHTFSAKEVPSLLEDYLSESLRAGFREVRIIHGKGKGHLREKVHSFLNKSPLVDSFALADHSAGSWGATVVKLKEPP